MYVLRNPTGTDASFSRTYLTAKNNPYKPIHRVPSDAAALAERCARNTALLLRGKRTECTLPGVLIPSTPLHKSRRSSVRVLSRSTGMDDEDIARLPESSDEDDVQTIATAVALPTPVSTQSPHRKRRQSGSERRLSKRLKPDNDQAKSRTAQLPQPVLDTASSFEWLSQPSQSSQKKRTQKYGSKKSYGADKLADLDNLQFNTPQKKAKQFAVSDLPNSPSTPLSSRLKRAANVPPLSQSPEQRHVKTAFAMPTEDGDEGESESIGLPNLDPLNNGTSARHRRGSTSSLSSLDSMASKQLDDSEKALLQFDLDQDPNSKGLKCPFCSRTTTRETLDSLKSGPAPAKTAAFCFDHRIADAKMECKEKGYPIIDPDSLSNSKSLECQIAKLPAIITREAPSFYLQSLDGAISDARGNQNKVKKYFDVTVLPLLSYGYYGPAGAKAISKAISLDAAVAKALRKAVKSDKSFRAAGHGGAMDCILVPEVLCRLVIADLNLARDAAKNKESVQEAARKLLEDTLDIGLLLHPDEDDIKDMGEDSFVDV